MAQSVPLYPGAHIHFPAVQVPPFWHLSEVSQVKAGHFPVAMSNAWLPGQGVVESVGSSKYTYKNYHQLFVPTTEGPCLCQISHLPNTMPSTIFWIIISILRISLLCVFWPINPINEINNPQNALGAIL